MVALFEYSVEILAGGLGWVDITADVRGGVRVTRGRSGEGYRADPGTCSFRLDNQTGRYSPRNVLSDLYGHIGRNTPVRVYAGPVGTTLVARFHGEIPAWPPRWSQSDADAWVDVDAGGLLRRYRQGDQPALSPIRRTIEGSTPVAYWPGEDGELSEQAGAAVTGLAPLRADGTVTFKQVADYTTFSGSTTKYGTTALADLAAGGSLTAQLPAGAVSATAAGAWTVHAMVRVDVTTLSGNLIVAEWTCTTGTYVRWQIRATTGSRTQVVAYTAAGAATTLIDYAGASSTFHHYAVSASLSGGTVTVQLHTSFPVSPSTTFAGTLGGVTAVEINPTGVTSTGEMPAGHIAVWSVAPLPLDLDGGTDTYGIFVREARRSYLNEAAVDRLIRIAAESGVTVDTATADALHVSRLGVQPTASTTALLDESIAVDGGLLSEDRDQLALAYLTRGDLYNRPALEITYAHTAPPFDPTDDADDVRNDITVTRQDGSSARAVQLTGPLAAVEPPDGVGIYKESETLNIDSDAALADQAGWRLHLGTVDEPRYPAITVQLANPEWTADPTLTADLIDLDVGGVLEVTDPPAWVAGRVRTLVTGYSETFDEFLWKVTFNGQPASPWDVAEVDGDPRVAADGTVLDADMTASATSFTFTSTDTNGAWTTDPGEFPLLVRVGGEVIEVSAISGAGLTQTADVSARGVNGPAAAWSAGTEVDVAEPAIVAL